MCSRVRVLVQLRKSAAFDDRTFGKKLLVGPSLAQCAHDFSEGTEVAFVVVCDF